jgi:hypothetical protein
VKEVLALIDKKAQEFTKLPFFEFLQDKSIDPRQRLGFAPCIAPFAMSFGELNRDVFRDESTLDKVQELINIHTHEDENHWPWLLEDIEKLGLNQSLQFNEALRFLWSAETKHARKAAYYLYHYTVEANPIQRLVVIDATEATGNVLLRMTAKVVRELQAKTKNNQDFPYFGSHHLVVDTGHTFCTTDGRKFLEAIQLNEQSQKEAFELVEKTFEVFANLMDELMRYAKAHNIEQQPQPLDLETLKNLLASNKYTLDADWSIPKVANKCRPLGSYLIDAGLVTSEQIEVALQEQQETAEPLGKLLSRRGWVNQMTVEYMMDKVIMPERELALKH